MDISADGFRKLESPDGIQEEENQFYDGEGDALPWGWEDGSSTFRNDWME